MLDSSLFERVTKNVNGKISGLKHTEHPEHIDEIKASVREFNDFVSKVILSFNSSSGNYKLKTKGVNKNWQNSGYYNPYFWNKILFHDNDYDGVIIWFLFNIEGLRISIGTTSTLESINHSLSTRINNDFKNIFLDDVNGFELKNDNEYASYLYIKDEVNKNYFVDALNTIVPRYKEVFTKYKNELFNNNTIDGNVDYLIKKLMNTKNIILYGSPGVGKTFNHKKLIALIEGNDFSQKDIFDFVINNTDDEIVEGSVETLFNKVQDENRMKFITFHQSFGYEDFIEGFRPNEDGNIELVDGIFKQLSNKAKDNLVQSIRNDNTLHDEAKKKKVFELFIDKVQDEIDVKGKYYINQTVYIFAIEDNAFRYQGDNWKNSQRMKFSDILLIMDFPSFGRKDIKTIPNISGLAKQHATYYSYLAKQLLDFREKVEITIEIDVKKEELKNYYLVIDEINRGNISKIFGELITLIEEDKRDNLEVTLPYSKQPFKIPSNLYIIGTMNSTDKSIAHIDIALRRRFTFLKMKPNVTLVADVAKGIFNSLNNQITQDLGEDYQIGHSYFMKIEDEDDLDFVLEYKIIPLLEEYYYGDDRFKEIVKLCKMGEGN